jgi:hypothetical protein
MPDTTFKSLDDQLRETGLAYWVCRPCQSFGQRVQHQFAESNKRHDATEKRVDANTRRIEDAERDIEELREALKKMEEKRDKENERREDNLCDEMQEREVRRMNLILHGVDEQPEEIRGNQERMEKDKERCERIFKEMKARTRKGDLRFCRRIGERGTEPRPIVIGLESEEEKRHILGRARELKNSRFHDVSIVPDLTRKQRNREARMKEEAEEKNKSLTAEEINRNIKWMVVGRRGEKRIIKGVEREQQQYGRRREERTRRDSIGETRQQRPAVPQPGTQPTAQLGPRLLPPQQDQREGRWYAKVRDETDLGARSKTTGRSENRNAGAADRQETRQSRTERDGAAARSQDETVRGRASRTATKRTRWSGTSSEEEEQRWTRQRR